MARPEPYDADVIIVGAGPVGLTGSTASHLTPASQRPGNE
jgi:hypothetical protein